MLTLSLVSKQKSVPLSGRADSQQQRRQRCRFYCETATPLGHASIPSQIPKTPKNLENKALASWKGEMLKDECWALHMYALEFSIEDLHPGGAAILLRLTAITAFSREGTRRQECVRLLRRFFEYSLKNPISTVQWIDPPHLCSLAAPGKRR